MPPWTITRGKEEMGREGGGGELMIHVHDGNG
jgi:hypothetical protein